MIKSVIVLHLVPVMIDVSLDNYVWWEAALTDVIGELSM